jgi:HNH endonuclease/AP2 domain
MKTKHKYDEDWHSLFLYDETSPSCLRWKQDRFRGAHKKQKFISAGDVVGSLNPLDGYWHVHTLGSVYNAHNIVWTMFNGVQGDLFIDHKNNNPADTRITNLRLVDAPRNARNCKKGSNNISGINGVFYREIKSRHGNGKHNDYWFAVWTNVIQKSKAFSIKKLGYEEAFRLACDYRSKMIAELNKQGAGYTENHGK